MIKLLTVVVAFFSVNVNAMISTKNSDVFNSITDNLLPTFVTTMYAFDREKIPVGVVTIKDNKNAKYDIKLGDIFSYVSTAQAKITETVLNCVDKNSNCETNQSLLNMEEIYTELQSIYPLLLLCFDHYFEKLSKYELLVDPVMNNIRESALDYSLDCLFNKEIIKSMTKYIAFGDVFSLVKRDGGVISKVMQKYSAK